MAEYVPTGSAVQQNIPNHLVNMSHLHIKMCKQPARTNTLCCVVKCVSDSL